MFDISLNGKNKYYTLYSHLREEILRGRLRSGEKLPSKRVLAEELGVSVITVQTAYEQLLAEGFIYSSERSGYFVEKINTDYYGKREIVCQDNVVEQKFKIDFVKGSPPPELFPFSVWAKLMRRVLSDCGEHLLERVSCSGDRQLREAVSAYLYRARGIDVDPRYVVIGAGAEHLYGVIVQILGRNKLYAVENPGYGKIASAYALNGAQVSPVAVGKYGIDFDGVCKSRADAVHVSPSHQYPTGVVMPARARSMLIEWANSGGKYLIEDDYDSEFRLTGKPLQCMYGMCPDRVIYMNTFSKSLAPSMRMGYMILPPELYKKFLELYGHSACLVPLFEQKTLAEMLDGGHFERHLNKLKNYYRGIRDLLLPKAERTDGCTVTDTGSGLHMIVKFNNASSDEEIKRRALKEGINLKCLSDYLLAPLKGTEKCAIINYSGVTAEQIKNFEFFKF